MGDNLTVQSARIPVKPLSKQPNGKPATPDATVPAQPNKPGFTSVPRTVVSGYEINPTVTIRPAIQVQAPEAKLANELRSLFTEMKKKNSETTADLNTSYGASSEKYVTNLATKLKTYSKFIALINSHEKQQGKEKTSAALTRFINEHPAFAGELFELSNMPSMVKGYVEQLLSVGVLASNYEASPTQKQQMLRLIAGTLASLGYGPSADDIYKQIADIKTHLEEPKKNDPNGKKVIDHLKKKGIDNVFDLTAKSVLALAKSLFPDSLFVTFERTKPGGSGLENYADLIRSETIARRSGAEQKIMQSNFAKGLRALLYKMPYGAMRVTPDGSLTSPKKGEVHPGTSCISTVEVMVKILFGKPEMKTEIETAYSMVAKSTELAGHPTLHNLSVKRQDGGQEQFKRLLAKNGRFFIVQTYASDRQRTAPVHAALIFEMGGKWKVLESADAWQTVKANGLEWWLGAHEGQSLTVIPMDGVLKSSGNKLSAKAVDPKFIDKLSLTAKEAFTNNGNKDRILEWMAARSKPKS